MHKCTLLQLAPAATDTASEWVLAKWQATEHQPVVASFLNSLKVSTTSLRVLSCQVLNLNVPQMLQVGHIFAWVDNQADGKLCLGNALQSQPDKALYFVRDTEHLVLPDNIQA